MRLALKISLAFGIFILGASIVVVPLLLSSHSQKVAGGERGEIPFFLLFDNLKSCVDYG